MLDLETLRWLRRHEICQQRQIVAVFDVCYD